MIGIEGIDGAGKQTQSSLLNSFFEKQGSPSKVMSFPDYSTRIGKEIKTFLSGRQKYPPAVRHMLFAANRWEKLEELTHELGNDGHLIVNRYTESNLVYGTANGLALDWVLNLEKGLPRPDLVIVLDASPSTLQSRRSRKDLYEVDFELQRRAQKIYQELAQKFGWVIIDASRKIEDVHASIIRIVSSRL